MRELTFEAWTAEGRKRFGDDPMKWRFVCPVCGHVARSEDWLAAGATDAAIAFSCVGRWIKGAREAFVAKESKGPCTYAGGGLFRLNPVRVVREGETHDVFEFAEDAG